MDVFDKFQGSGGPIGQYADFAHGYFAFPRLTGEIGPRMTFEGRERLIWSLNNYLGLANHPEVRRVDAQAGLEFGLAAPMGARMMSGDADYQEQLEDELSAFVEKEDSLLLNFGYQGMASMIDALVDRHDVVVLDSECHACIVDGVGLHGGRHFTFPHNDVDNLRWRLEKCAKIVEKSGGGILVITEGVFGMSGTQGRLREIVELKERIPFRLLVDDAHGFGTLGADGNGAGHEQGVQDGIDLYFSTFAKAMSSIGAFVSGDAGVIQYLRYNIRSQTFSKVLPAPIYIGALKRLELIRNHPEYRQRLWAIARALQTSLRDSGLDIGSTDSVVTPVYVKGGIVEAANVVHDLRENHDVFCSCVVYPVVPKDVILLRLIPTALHVQKDVDETVEAFRAVKERLERGAYPDRLPERERSASISRTR